MKKYERCKELKIRFNGNFKNILFTDEKIFNMEVAFNSHNTRVWTTKDKKNNLNDFFIFLKKKKK